MAETLRDIQELINDVLPDYALMPSEAADPFDDTEVVKINARAQVLAAQLVADYPEFADYPFDRIVDTAHDYLAGW